VFAFIFYSIKDSENNISSYVLFPAGRNSILSYRRRSFLRTEIGERPTVGWLPVAKYHSTIAMGTVTLDILHVTAFEKKQSEPPKEEADLYWTTAYSLHRRLRGEKKGPKVTRVEENK
jgi:hypothetical protein